MATWCTVVGTAGFDGPMGSRSIAHQFSVDTEAFDFVLGTDFFAEHPQILKPVRTPVAILGSLGVCIYVPASRHRLISYSPIHLT